MTLDSIPIGQRARVIAIDWAMLEPDEVTRLQGLGLEPQRQAPAAGLALQQEAARQNWRAQPVAGHWR